MTISYATGRIWDAKATYIAVSVAIVPGIMGDEMIKEAARRWPDLKDIHDDWCRVLNPKGGDVDIICDRRGQRPQLMFVATKENWRQPSRIEWIELGLHEIRLAMFEDTSVALPMLGCGHGGPDPADVMALIEHVFGTDPRMAEIYQ